MLEVLQGRHTVAEASRALGIREARFHQLRQQALEGALAGLSPKRAGRPVRRPSIEPSDVERLRAENQELKIDLRALELREEIALSMPHLLKARSGKKISGAQKRRRRRARQ